MPAASIVIVTRNRKAVAEKAVASALAQEGDLEVLIVDDGSTDDTTPYLRDRFPDPRLAVHRFERQEGYIVQRNRGANLARASVIYSIDDDAVFDHPRVLRDTLHWFDHPRVGALLIPFHNVGSDGREQLMTPLAPGDGRTHVTNSFIGTAYGVRRDVFQRLGGFQEALYHWGEESEFCLRLLAAGFVVAVNTRPHIRHFPGSVAGKYTRQVNRYLYRNRLLTLWWNAPTLYVAPLLAMQTALALKQGVTHPRDLPTVIEGLTMGLATMVRSWRTRRAIPRPFFNLWLELRRRKLVPIDEVIPRLPPMVDVRALSPRID